MLHYFWLILLNLLNNVILYQLWWDAKCLYEVQIPKCDWCSIGSQCTNIYGDLWREWEGVLFLGSNSGEDLHEFHVQVVHFMTFWSRCKIWGMGRKQSFETFSFCFPSCPLVLHFLSHDFLYWAYIVILVGFISVGTVLGKAFRILG